MSKLAIDRNSKGIQVLKPSSTETVSVSGTAASNTALDSSGAVRVQRIVSDANIFYDLTGTATTSSVYLPAGVVEYIHVTDADQFSFITGGSTGTVYVTDMV